MPKIKTISSEWGVLAANQSLSPTEIDHEAHALLAQMSLAEKISQMSGDLPVFPTVLEMLWKYNMTWYPAGENLRLDLPGIRFSDGPRGIVMNHATSFPVSVARGATWDIELEERIGEVMGMEARALGANLVAAVCINTLRHPAWGRAQETYGEDSYHLSEMGAALVRGIQKHAMACIKHFAANSMENNRQKVDVRMGERTLREVYLPHFKRCVDEGAACVMSAYNRLNGAFCSQNHRLLTEILKEEWGFQGFVMSDFVTGLHDARAGVEAGLDMEMPFAAHYGKKLTRLVEKGIVAENLIDQAVLRILRQKMRFSQVGRQEGYPDTLVACPDHRALARQAALESIVLLKNEPPSHQYLFPEKRRDLSSMFALSKQAPVNLKMRVGEAKRFGIIQRDNLDEPLLPLSLDKVRRIAVIGRLAAKANLGDHGSSQTRPSEVIDILMGLQEYIAGRAELAYEDGFSTTDAADLARKSDVAVLVVGLSHRDEGENMVTRGGDRKSLRLSAEDIALILTVTAANPSTIVLLMGSGVVMTEFWLDYVPALLLVWYPGMEGGRAIAQILFGEANPSGKLPVSFPRSEDQLPPFDNRAATVEYGYYHGYRLLERNHWQPAFPFGFGLSYTTFTYQGLRVAQAVLSPQDTLEASLQVTNSGTRRGDEVVQVYIGYPTSGQGAPRFGLSAHQRESNRWDLDPHSLVVERPVKELKGFRRISLEPGQTCQVTFQVTVEDLGYYDEGKATWVIQEGEYTLYVGASSADRDLLQYTFRVQASPPGRGERTDAASGR